MLINRKAGEEYGLFRYAALYSELAGRLDALREKYPQNLRYESIGKSNEGRDILLVMVGEDVGDGWLAAYQAQRAEAYRDPDGFRARMTGREKLPVMFNCNLHGSEISGTDGMLSFIDELLSTELKGALACCNLFISLCMNPDGRSRGYDILNGQGVDLNRDWMTQSQPEIRALIEGIFRRFYPAVLVDLHGFMGSANIIIDACTPPHNPFFEYDLLEPTLIENARAMAGCITERVGVDCDIPAVDWKDGWEDYSPIYTPVFFLCLGTVAHTIETNFPSPEGAYIIHCAAVGLLEHLRGSAQTLLRNQCEIWSRGIHDTPQAQKTPAYYRIPAAGQRDLAPVYETVNLMLRNGLRVCTAPNGDFVVPAAQPLRTLVHNMLWQGEDISDKIDNCYDISFYSYPVMRGFCCEPLDRLDEPLTDLAGSVALRREDALPAGAFAVSGGTIDSVRLINAMVRAGCTVRRETATGNLRIDSVQERELAASFAKTHDLRFCAQDGGAVQRIDRVPRILTVADSGGVDELLCELGFESAFLPFSELNRGYRIDESQYDLLVVGGTDYALWNDVFDDLLGNTYQVSWALRERGRRELARAVQAMPSRILYGFSGLRLSEGAGLFETAETKPVELSTSTGKQTAENWMLSVPNGAFSMRLDPSHPLCLGYREQEIFYLVAPVTFSQAGGDTPIRFAPAGSFLNGFNKRKGETDGQIAAVCRKTAAGGDVLLGFDPSFRKYTDESYRILTNAVYYTLF